MTTREIGALVHGLCIVTAVMACSSWTVPLSTADMLAMPRNLVGQSVTTRPATPPNYILA